MTADEEGAGQVTELLGDVDLAGALESDRFRHFLDQIPIAIAVAELKDGERIVYANPRFEELLGTTAAAIEGKSWTALDNQVEIEQADRRFGSAVAAGADYIGTFRMEGTRGEPAVVDAYSNVIQDDGGNPVFRLAALVNVRSTRQFRNENLEQLVREKGAHLPGRDALIKGSGIAGRVGCWA